MKSPFFSRLLLGFLLLFALSASAARLESDRDEIAVGEIVTINLKGAPFIALVEWKVSPELEVIESDDKHVRVRGIQPGAGMVTCEMNLSVHKRAVRVSGSAPARRPDDVRPPPPPVMPPPPPVTPPQRQTPPGAVAGIWQITSEGDSGYLELRMDRGILLARLRMDSTNQWEDMQDVRFDGAIDELSFSRPATNQSFRGQYRGESLQGRTTQWGGRGYSGATPSGQWSASRGGLRDARHLRGHEPNVAQPAIHPDLSIQRGQYAPGEAIVVSFTAPASYANDAWIGIIPSAIPHGSEAENDRHDLTYQYLQKRTGGSLSFNAPTQPGDYDLRMHDTDNNGREVASVSFRVGAAGDGGSGRGYTADRPHDPGPASDRGSSEKEIQELMNQLRGLMGR